MLTNETTTLFIHSHYIAWPLVISLSWVIKWNPGFQDILFCNQLPCAPSLVNAITIYLSCNIAKLSIAVNIWSTNVYAESNFGHRGVTKPPPINTANLSWFIGEFKIINSVRLLYTPPQATICCNDNKKQLTSLFVQDNEFQLTEKCALIDKELVNKNLAQCQVSAGLFPDPWREKRKREKISREKVTYRIALRSNTA